MNENFKMKMNFNNDLRLVNLKNQNNYLLRSGSESMGRVNHIFCLKKYLDSDYFFLFRKKR